MSSDAKTDKKAYVDPYPKMTEASTDANYYVDDTIWLSHFNDLQPANGGCIVEYVWIGGSGMDLRSKSRTLDKVPKTFEDCPEWNFDGSSTQQAPGNDSEVLCRPVAMFRDPFRRDPHKIVLCSCYKPDGTPVAGNNRHLAEGVFQKVADQKPWFGIEQESSLLTRYKRPLGWPTGGYPGPQGPYYCGNGLDRAFGRSFVEAHYKACLYAGIRVSGINAEVMPSQWEFQVGAVEGIAAADQVWMARYFMHRLGELFRLEVTFDPKLIPGDWNGAGCHVNFSTVAMREAGGLRTIVQAVEKLKPRHKWHLKHYGIGNERRLTGKHETASIDVFTYGVADRGASVRIPRETDKNGCGYFEDRRPASNMDPYLVTRLLCETCLLDVQGDN